MEANVAERSMLSGAGFNRSGERQRPWEIWRVEYFDMKRRPECLPVLPRSNNWREWNMKRWTMKGKRLKFPLVTYILRMLLSSRRIILKNYEYSPINTERKLQPHPRIIFKRQLGGVRVAKCLPDMQRALENSRLSSVLGNDLIIFSVFFPVTTSEMLMFTIKSLITCLYHRCLDSNGDVTRRYISKRSYSTDLWSRLAKQPLYTGRFSAQRYKLLCQNNMQIQSLTGKINQIS